MVNAELISLQRAIDNIILDAESTLEADDEKKSHLAKYTCILISGFLENAVYQVYRDYAILKSTDTKILQFVEGRLKDINNPSGGRLINIANQFNESWGTELSNYLNENNRKGAIGNIISNRHKIAHGELSDITMNRIKQDWIRVIETVEFIEQQCI